MKPLCAVLGCGRKVDDLSWCHGHYERQRRGAPLGGPFLDTPEKRFWAKVDKNGPVPSRRPDLGPCWLWIGAQAGPDPKVDPGGKYGRFYIGGTTHQAHRVSYEWAGNTIPAGYEVDHLCSVRLCVRPSHLEAVTPYENGMRSTSLPSLNARKTRCIRGHAFTPDNTYVGRRGGRSCRACRALRKPKAAAQRHAKRLANLGAFRAKEAAYARQWRQKRAAS